VAWWAAKRFSDDVLPARATEHGEFPLRHRRHRAWRQPVRDVLGICLDSRSGPLDGRLKGLDVSPLVSQLPIQQHQIGHVQPFERAPLSLTRCCSQPNANFLAGFSYHAPYAFGSLASG
jgi:hypothetical protein